MDKKQLIDEIITYLREEYFYSGIVSVTEHDMKYSAAQIAIRTEKGIKEYLITVSEGKLEN